MRAIVQSGLTNGWGGLEMIVCEFHAWLKKNDIPTKILCLRNAPLEQNAIKLGFGADIIAVNPGFKRFREARLALKKFDSEKTVFLFHQQQGIRSTCFSSFKARKIILCHTFYDVQKRDLWHRFLFSRVDHWITLTQKQKLNLEQTIVVLEEKISVIPNGVNLELFKPTLRTSKQFNKTEPIHIGLNSRLDPKKGHEIAIKALEILKNTFSSNIHLHFFGDNTPFETPYRPVLERLATEKGLERNVHFEGFTAQMEKSIPQMDLIWVPSLQETFGRCILEALACKVPVVASNAGGIPEILTHNENGLLFRSGCQQELAEQTSRLLTDSRLYQYLQSTGYRLVCNKFNADLIWPKLVEVMRAGHEFDTGFIQDTKMSSSF